MVIFFATYRTFEQFFPLLFILKKNFSTWNAAIYLNFHYFLFFTNCEKESTLTHTVLEKRLRYLQDTVLQCIFPKTHISIYCYKTYIHTPNLWCLSFFLVHLLPKNMCLQFVWHLFLELEYSKNVTYRTLPTGPKCNSW